MSNISLQVYVFFLKFKKSILLVLVLLILLWNFLGFLIFEGYLLYEVACVLQSPPVPVDSAFRLVPKSGTVIPCEEIYKLFPPLKEVDPFITVPQKVEGMFHENFQVYEHFTKVSPSYINTKEFSYLETKLYNSNFSAPKCGRGLTFFSEMQINSFKK